MVQSPNIPHTNRDLSWLAFNARVLQEARDPRVPLLERLRFLGIFSSNQDEFYRVRVATLHRLTELGKKARAIVGEDPELVLQKIQATILDQQEEFQNTYDALVVELARERVRLVDEVDLTPEQGEYVRDYFLREVRSKLTPLMLRRSGKFPELVDKSIYLATRLVTSEGKRNRFALIEVPNTASRFVRLPPNGGVEYVILLEDVVRFNLERVFSIFSFEKIESHIIKLTRDAELDLDDDVSDSYIQKVAKGLRNRKEGNPVRLVYDQAMSQELLSLLKKKLKFRKDDKLVPGGRYHNFKDFIDFPVIGDVALTYPKVEPRRLPAVDRAAGLLSLIKKRDVLLHFPYQAFDYVTALLREAAIDPKVTAIRIALYRVARESEVVQALINAARNGKAVTVVVELQARFDEAANVQLANQLRSEGAEVIFGVPGLKVHSKIGLIVRREKGRIARYAILGTGNFNESTARLYSDHCLMTADRGITKEVENVFDFLHDNYRVSEFAHLIVSPFGLRNWIEKMIRREIKNAKKGRHAAITIKLNNLSESQVSGLLYEAADAGVKIRLIVRGTFSLRVDATKHPENIEAVGIIDRFLEHSRILVFENGGSPQFFLSSADWMRRNLDRRVEVTFPVYDPDIQQQLSDYLEIQWRDNVKARILDATLSNRYRDRQGREHRSQMELIDFARRLEHRSVRRKSKIVRLDKQKNRAQASGS